MTFSSLLFRRRYLPTTAFRTLGMVILVVMLAISLLAGSRDRERFVGLRELVVLCEHMYSVKTIHTFQDLLRGGSAHLPGVVLFMLHRTRVNV